MLGKKLIKYISIKGRKISIQDISGFPFVKNTWSITGKDTDGTRFINSTTTGKTNALKIAKNFMHKHPKG